MKDFKDLKIAVAGTGYVGLSLGVLLSQHHQVVAVDIVQAKVDMINNKKSPIQDDYIEKYLAEKELNLTATLDAKAAYSDADFVVIAAPTNYDSKTQHFDTSAVEAVIKLVMEYNPNAIMVIKSTIPVGYTASVRKKFNTQNIIFSPWRKGDLEGYGQLVFESGKSSIYSYECGCDELKKLYEIMTDTDGIYGGRFSGAGFKGCCMALIDPDKAEDIEVKVTTEYLKAFPALDGKYSFHLCESADGVEL